MPEADRSPRVARFEGFSLDATTGELRRPDTGVARLPEQSLRILLLLLEHPGELVQREEIRKKLWPNDTVVEFEHSISAAVNRLRQALGDSAEKPKFVETLARRGYRWMVSVEWADKGAQPHADPGEVVKSPKSFEASLIGRKVSHYRVLKILDGGGMGIVYEAEDLKLGRRLALKFLPEELGDDPKAIERFEQEARAASALDHPNICAIHEFGEHQGQPFIVMPLLRGQTLRERIAAEDLMGLDTILDIALQIANGLDAAHEKGIIHRDIKPANIFITDRGEARILDFGLAKIFVDEEQTEIASGNGYSSISLPPKNTSPTDWHLTQPGLAMGTAAYMSPEQIRGEKLDARTDLFSFGLVLYEMTTGHQAFTGNTAAELRAAILNDRQSPAVDLNPNLPSKLGDIIQRALEKDREARYSSASDMRAELQALKSPKQENAAGEKSGSKLWLKLTLAGVLLAIVGTGGVLWFLGSKPDRQTQLKQRQITTNINESSVFSGAISPDGKYLAYADAAGMYLKLIPTGEVRPLPPPEELRGHHIDWWLSWFPDGSRLFATASVIGRRDSIWTISVVGGQPHKIRDNATSWTVSPNGNLMLFSTNRGRINDDDREIWLMDTDGENAHKILEAEESSGFSFVDWSPDGQRLAYSKAQMGPGGVELVFESRDLKGEHPVRILSGKGLKDFKWLPDGRIVYIRGEPDLNLSRDDLWEQRVNATTGEPEGKPRQVTHWAGFGINSLSATANGKELVYRRVWAQRSVHVADLVASPAHISAQRQLTHSEGNELPVAWTADGDTVLFVSNRTGPWGIFKQSLRDETAESLVGSAFQYGYFIPGLIVSGESVLYIDDRNGRGFTQLQRLMRVPLVGGRPELVLSGHLQGLSCARSHTTLCVFGERMADGRELVFSSLDPVRGRGKEITRMNVDFSSDYDWDLSPDGSQIAIHKRTETPIQLIPLVGGTAKQLDAMGWNSIENLHWAADGKGFYAASRTVDSSVLLYLDMQGTARVVWEQKGTMGNLQAGTSGIPSPDGRHLAMMGYAYNANMWTLEDF
jgi:serine/threonine protein kinase